MISELGIEKLNKNCDPAMLGCQASDELAGPQAMIGQQRALRALRFGLGIQELGFNIYVAGLPGTGRTTAVKRFLEELAQAKAVPSDWCYVNNFGDPYRPRALRLPPGQARSLQTDMKRMVETAQDEIRRAFESEEYATRQEQITHSFQQQREEIMARVNEQARQEGFLIQVTPLGLATIPMRNGKPLSEEEYIALGEEDKHAISEKRETIQSALEAAFRQGKGIEKEAREAIEELDRQIALHAIAHLVQSARDRYTSLPEVIAYLEQVQADILEHLDRFRSDPEDKSAAPFAMQRDTDHPFSRYEVNVIVDHSDLKGAPVIIESNPTYGNLFGRMEQEARFGTLVTDFTMIRGGALHLANGGYLVLQIEEVLRNSFAWEGLKRALANRQITIEDVAERYGLMTTRSLRPEPIPIAAKVILIGRPDLYHLLQAYDEEFAELFKVKADFDTRMDRTDETAKDYAAFVCSVCARENLKHLDNQALAQIVEHSSRIAEDQAKLSTRFGEIADVIREASYYATVDDVPYATADHVRKAIDERFYRSNLIQERIQERIERGTIIIDTEGQRVGQINGLSVIDLGDISFGQPSRITVSVGAGREGLVDIEREAKLGGPIHTKGVLILSGYLASKYAHDKPLSLSARLVFEQSYSGVEGDSASSTELYGILSALSGLPIKQGIAVTGSVNQKGQVQAIGGANEKIEGFFEICKAKGLTGEQGVILPASNVQNLMLKKDVVEAVRQGSFHIWAVQTIDEGIEVLTGVPAGQPQEDGSFPDGTVNKLVDERLQALAERMKEFAKPEGTSKEPPG